MPEPAQRPCRIILVGMMGSGKSTVGALLAERTGWPFHDNDVLLRELFDATPREVLAAGDEASLLAAEVEALAAGLARPAPSIVAAAGGTIQAAAARDAMTGAGVPVWLRISAATSFSRSAGGDHRPWPDADRARWIRDAMRRRHDLYAAIASMVLDTDEAATSILADRILSHARAHAACGSTPG